MSKPQNMSIPDETYAVYRALAKSQGTTPKRLMMDSLKQNWAVQILGPFVKRGRFDEGAFRADIAKASKAFKQWDEENADALEELWNLSNPPKRRRR